MPVFDLRRPNQVNQGAAIATSLARSFQSAQQGMFRMQQLNTDREYQDIAKQRIADGEKDRRIKLFYEMQSQWSLDDLDRQHPEIVQQFEKDTGATLPREIETGRIVPTFQSIIRQQAATDREAQNRRLDAQAAREASRFGMEQTVFGQTQADRALLEKERGQAEKASKFLIKQFPTSPFSRYLRANPKMPPNLALKNFSYAELATRATTGEITGGMEAYTDEDLRLIAFGKRPATETASELALKYALTPEAVGAAVPGLADAGSRFIPPAPPGMQRVGGRLVPVGAAPGVGTPGAVPEAEDPIRMPSGAVAIPLPDIDPAQSQQRGPLRQVLLEAEVQRVIDDMRDRKISKSVIKRALAEAKAQGLEVK